MSDRFTIISIGNMGYLINDKITKKTYDNVQDMCTAMNDLWEQTLRFENHNQELVQRSIKYEDQIDELKIENNLLKSGDDLTDCECEVAKLKKQLNETTELLHKEIKTSENAFDGLMQENKKLKEQLDNLFQYYCRWFEEERGTYPGDFARSWQAIADGEIDDDYED